MDELRSLNIDKLQLQLDIVDIINDKKKHYQQFLHEFVHSISRIFFDSSIITSSKFDTKTNLSFVALIFVS